MSTTTEQQPIIELRGITKKFGQVIANHNIHFKIFPGEIHAVLGGNGAGKSTLMNILNGIYRPDKGTIYFQGKKARIRSPKDSLDHGIGMLHQHFRLVEDFTVAENIALGNKLAGFFYSRKAIEKNVAALSETYHLPVPPDAIVYQLSVAEKQRVEILKILSRKSKILIFDEPTAILSPVEVSDFFDILRGFVALGHTIIFISHKLPEVLEISNRISLMQDGKMIFTALRKDTDEAALIKMMCRDEPGKSLTEKVIEVSSSTLLDIKNLEVKDDKGLKALNQVQLTVQAGELLGIAGISGNGQIELAEALIGLRPLSKGKIAFNGEDISAQSVRHRLDAGMAYIPADRKKYGIAGNLNLLDNFLLTHFEKAEFKKSLFFDAARIKAFAQQLMDQYQIIPRDLTIPLRFFSGGNIQKVIIARELARRLKLLIAAYPLRGLDLETCRTVVAALKEAKKKGIAIIYISEELSYLFELCDRIAVMFRGRIVQIFDKKAFDLNQISSLMAGQNA